MEPINANSTVVIGLMDRYIGLEGRIHELWPSSFTAVCGRCTRVCCRPHMAEDLLDSDWLRDVSERVHGDWWNTHVTATGQCAALGTTGCILKAGKHPFCRHFSCDDIINASADGPSLIAQMFLSGILMQVSRLKKGVSLMRIDRNDFERTAPHIDAALIRGEEELRLYEAFIEARTPGDEERIALRMVTLRPSTITGGVQNRLKTLGFY